MRKLGSSLFFVGLGVYAILAAAHIHEPLLKWPFVIITVAGFATTLLADVRRKSVLSNLTDPMRRIYNVINENGPLTFKAAADTSGLCERELIETLHLLQDVGLVRSREKVPASDGTGRDHTRDVIWDTVL